MADKGFLKLGTCEIIIVDAVALLKRFIIQFLCICNLIYTEGIAELFCGIRFYKGTPRKPVILAAKHLFGKVAAFMAEARHTVANAAIHIVGLPGVLVNKLSEIQIVRVIGDQVETIVCIGAGCHIDVCTAADSDDALSADGIAVEGMPRPGSAHWEGPSISPSLRIIGCALGRFQPPFLLGQVIESEEAEEAINSCFFILDIGVVAGTAAIFQGSLPKKPHY